MKNFEAITIIKNGSRNKSEIGEALEIGISSIEKIDQIQTIINACEEVCDYDAHESEYTARCAKLTAYDHIKAIMKGE